MAIDLAGLDTVIPRCPIVAMLDGCLMAGERYRGISPTASTGEINGYVQVLWLARDCNLCGTNLSSATGSVKHIQREEATQVRLDSDGVLELQGGSCKMDT